MSADPLPGWLVRPVVQHRGGTVRTNRREAPVGRLLPYRRSEGEGPPQVTGLAEELSARGWSVRLHPIGDMLLQMGLVRGLADAYQQLTGTAARLSYAGPFADLMRRCTLDLAVSDFAAGHHFGMPGTAPRAIRVRAATRPCEWPADVPHPDPGYGAVLPAWLDLTARGDAELHSALPMRHYLDVEYRWGIRLPLAAAPAPMYRTGRYPRPRQVTFVGTSSEPRKDYGLAGFSAIARTLVAHGAGDHRFRLLLFGDGPDPRPSFAGLPFDVLPDLPVSDCVDVFGESELVVGNDTGLTHLAALTVRPDGSSPTVVGLYGEHNYLKWTTGLPHHHAVATALSHMMALADGDLFVNRLDPAAWGESGEVTSVPPDVVATFAGECAEWW